MRKKYNLMEYIYSCYKCNNVMVLYVEHESQLPDIFKCVKCGEERYPTRYDHFIVKRIKNL